MNDSERLRQLEANLSASEERYRMIVEATDDAIWEYDVATEKMLWSSKIGNLVGEVPGKESESLQWWVDQIHSDDRERVVAPLQSAIRNTASASASASASA